MSKVLPKCDYAVRLVSCTNGNKLILKGILCSFDCDIYQVNTTKPDRLKIGWLQVKGERFVDVCGTPSRGLTGKHRGKSSGCNMSIKTFDVRACSFVFNVLIIVSLFE